MNSDAIRRAFISYFEERGHLHLPGLSLVPNDASITTLFTIAGMQQMTPYFLGRETPPSSRMVTVQKAVRTNDIEEVGDDSHLTYLEMLGNFAVGDYFKREAIIYTWDFLVNHLRIPAERWWGTIYPNDDEAHAAWVEVGMPVERIGPDSTNWWGPAGPYGPCGPNSEIHFDRGEEYSCGRVDCRPETGCCDRFVETWNDVFMTYFQEENGDRRELPWKNIDTGMGFERLVAIVQGVKSPYETDLFEPIIAAIAGQCGQEYGSSATATRSMRIIADHTRACTMLIADGVMPSSEGRGYVVRRLLRRAALHGRSLGLDRPFLKPVVEAVIFGLRGFHTALDNRRRHILQVIDREEARFLQTLSRGLAIFEELASRAESGDRVIAGSDAFVLYDTHGFPLEMTIELAAEHGLTVDQVAFTKALEEQRTRARANTEKRSLGTSPEVFAALSQRISPSRFSGYDELRTVTEVQALVVNGQAVDRVEAEENHRQQVDVILASTPFYAESGGQIGDTGVISGDGGVLQVLDTQRPYAQYIVHTAEVKEGVIAVGDIVEAEVDTARRLHILPHHSGTHLVHRALQDVLGPEATQAGSAVEPERLRFDFRWPRPLTDEEVHAVEEEVNAAIWANLPVHKSVMPYDEAIRAGAMALFGEKYGNEVRVVSMGDWSKELCGGTHVDSTGEIGSLVIVSETGIGAGIRRIEAVAGAAAYAHLTALRHQVTETADALETQPSTLVNRARQVRVELHNQVKQIEVLTRRLAMREAESLLQQAVTIDNMTVVAGQVTADTMDQLKAITDAVKSRLERGAIILASVVDGSPKFTMALTSGLSNEGYHAGNLLREAVVHAEGKAGGKPDFAQGGGNDASRVGDVLQAAISSITRKANEPRGE